MKIFSFALPLAGRRTCGVADDGQHVAVCGAGAAAVCTAGMDIPHCVDDSLCAHGLGESARAAVRLAGGIRTYLRCITRSLQ